MRESILFFCADLDEHGAYSGQGGNIDVVGYKRLVRRRELPYEFEGYKAGGYHK